MFHHICIYVSDMQKSKILYKNLLKIIGYDINDKLDHYYGFDNYTFGLLKVTEKHM